MQTIKMVTFACDTPKKTSLVWLIICTSFCLACIVLQNSAVDRMSHKTTGEWNSRDMLTTVPHAQLQGVTKVG